MQTNVEPLDIGVITALVITPLLAIFLATLLLVIQRAQSPSCKISTTECFIACEVPQAGNPFSLSPTVGSTSPSISCGHQCSEEQLLNKTQIPHEGKPPGTDAPVSALRPAFNNPNPKDISTRKTATKTTLESDRSSANKADHSAESTTMISTTHEDEPPGTNAPALRPALDDPKDISTRKTATKTTLESDRSSANEADHSAESTTMISTTHEGEPPGTNAPALRPAFNNPKDIPTRETATNNDAHISSASIQIFSVLYLSHLVLYPALAPQHDDNNGYELEEAAPARLPCYDDAYVSFLNAWSTPIGNVNYEAALNNSSTSFPPPSPTRVPRPKLPPGPRRRERCDD